MWINNDPLERPKVMPTKSDQNSDALFCAIGHALTEWELLEEYMGLIFAAFVGARNVGAAIRAYSSVISPSTRASLLRDTADVFFYESKDERLSDGLSQMLNRYSKAAARRNDIAHGIVVSKEANGYFLVPGFLSRKRSVSRIPMYEYTRYEVDHYASQFTALREVVNEYQSELADALPQLEAARERRFAP